MKQFKIGEKVDFSWNGNKLNGVIIGISDGGYDIQDGNDIYRSVKL